MLVLLLPIAQEEFEEEKRKAPGWDPDGTRVHACIDGLADTICGKSIKLLPFYFGSILMEAREEWRKAWEARDPTRSTRRRD